MAFCRKRRYLVLAKPNYTLNDLEFRPISPCDIQKIRIWRNCQIEVLRQAEKVSWFAQRRYFARNVFNQFMNPEPDQILLGIIYQGVLLGYGGLVHINWIESHGEVSFLLNPLISENSDRYEEVFLSFLEVIAYIAFDELGFDRIMTETYGFRIKHIQILERFGMKRNGVFCNRAVLNNQYFDSILHSRNREELKYEN